MSASGAIPPDDDDVVGGGSCCCWQLVRKFVKVKIYLLSKQKLSSVQFGLVRFRWVGLEFEVKLRPAGSPVGVLIVQSMIFYPKAIAND